MPVEPVRYCLVTGAAGGIGASLVEVFAGAGYRVIGIDRIPQPSGLPCTSWHQIDLAHFVTDEIAAEHLLQSIREETAAHGLHALINNAAVQILGDADSLNRLDWSQTLQVNLVAPFLLIQGLLPELEFAQGSVVNIGSIHARLTKKAFVAYATSKAALAGMTRALAVDLGRRVRINAIEPAAIETAMLRSGFKTAQESFRKLNECHPSQRIGTPREVASLAFFLTQGTIDFLHGSIISLDGGISHRLFDPE